jgi:hypothetical protein
MNQRWFLKGLVSTWKPEQRQVLIIISPKMRLKSAVNPNHCIVFIASPAALSALRQLLRILASPAMSVRLWKIKRKKEPHFLMRNQAARPSNARTTSTTITIVSGDAGAGCAAGCAAGWAGGCAAGGWAAGGCVVGVGGCTVGVVGANPPPLAITKYDMPGTVDVNVT